MSKQRTGPRSRAHTHGEAFSRERFDWWLDPIPEKWREDAIASAKAGDIIGFLIGAGNEYSLHLVFYNMERLKQLGLYERALLDAFTATRTNNIRMMSYLRLMFALADRKRLREASDTLPGGGPYKLYRGVAGVGRTRHVRGLSWTTSLATAKHFAVRYARGFISPRASLENPSVYQTTVSANDVLAYFNRRGEQEMIVRLPDSNKPKRILDAVALRAEAAEIAAWHYERVKQDIAKYGQRAKREHAAEIAAMRRREAALYNLNHRG